MRSVVKKKNFEDTVEFIQTKNISLNKDISECSKGGLSMLREAIKARSGRRSKVLVILLLFVGFFFIGCTSEYVPPIRPISVSLHSQNSQTAIEKYVNVTVLTFDGYKDTCYDTKTGKYLEDEFISGPIVTRSSSINYVQDTYHGACVLRTDDTTDYNFIFCDNIISSLSNWTDKRIIINDTMYDVTCIFNNLNVTDTESKYEKLTR